MIDDIRARFKDFSKSGYFAKADPNSNVDWNIGLDGEGRQALKLRGMFHSQNVEDTKIVGVSQFRKGDRGSLVFSLFDNRFEEQFYYFCCDLISATESSTSDDNSYRVAVANYSKWKKMFKNVKSDFLSEIEIMGLIAEILFLDEFMIPAYGEYDAVRSWTGQEYTKKDFSINDNWYEIKAVSKGKNTVHISSLGQLDGSGVGHLVVYPMEKMSGVHNSMGLNNLVKSVYDRIQSEDCKELFLEKASLHGFVFHEYYENYKYLVDTCRKYTVTDGFPRLIADNIYPAIIRAEYDIDITALKEFEQK